MKTWRMIEKLAENRELRFVSDEQPDNPIGVINGTLCWLKSEKPMHLNFKSFMNVGTIDNHNWEPVREPVDFIIAFNSDRRVSSEDGVIIKCDPWWLLKNRSVTQEQINGKWFIE